MQALLVLILVWIGQVFPQYDVSKIDFPTVRFLRPAELNELLWPDQSAQFRAENRANGAYVWRTHTIYLRDDWSPLNDDDLAVLVHETVHHVQIETNHVFACKRVDMEEEAYAAQELWLERREGHPVHIDRHYKTYVKSC